MTLRASEAAAQCIVIAPVCLFVCMCNNRSVSVSVTLSELQKPGLEVPSFTADLRSYMHDLTIFDLQIQRRTARLTSSATDASQLRVHG